jgi:hypothetical protein
VTPNLECLVVLDVSCNTPECNVSLVGLAMDLSCAVALLLIILLFQLSPDLAKK